MDYETKQSGTVGDNPDAGPEQDRGVIEEAKRQAQAAREQAQETSARAASAVKEGTWTAAEKLKERTGEAAARMRSQGSQFAEQQKQWAANKTLNCSDVASDAAERLRAGGDPNLAHFADSMADGIRQAGNYLKDQDFNGLFRDAEATARKHPEVIYGGLFVAGLALARFMKARPREDDPERGSAETASAVHTTPSDI